MEIRVIGGGLAGVEAAYQIAEKGQRVTLYEMRPKSCTPAHKTAHLSELVCSNSMKSKEVTNAHGLLKEELRRLGSLVVRIADETSIPGGKALVVDRDRFAGRVTEKIEAHPLITIIREEVKDIPTGIVIIATGPLTSDALAETIRVLTGSKNLYFYDAISPIVDADTIDMGNAFFGSRYTKESDDYLNCPLAEHEYDRFYDELVTGERVSLRDFEEIPYFEGCLPVEVMAERGRQTLLYGPMKPVGLIDTRTGKEPYAVIQLRREDRSGSMYNMVGFQTKLTYQEQERIFGLVPALKRSVFLRHGSIHRNTYINSPTLLHRNLSLIQDERIFFAGQITGVEGYIESAANGLVAGIAAYLMSKEKPFVPPPEDTCVGALLHYVTTEKQDFQPMNMNFGLLKGYKKREKEKAVERALSSILMWSEKVG